MIVERQTWLVKRDRVREAVELAVAEFKEINPPHAVRFYTPRFGPRDVLVRECEFENVQEHDEFWAEWRATRRAPFMDKWNEVMERFSTEEIWNLVELD